MVDLKRYEKLIYVYVVYVYVMAQQLTVKAFLKRWNDERKRLDSAEEIRRFSVDQDVATSYAYLLAKVTAVFPGLNNKSITLYWKG